MRRRQGDISGSARFSIALAFECRSSMRGRESTLPSGAACSTNSRQRSQEDWDWGSRSANRSRRHTAPRSRWRTERRHTGLGQNLSFFSIGLSRIDEQPPRYAGIVVYFGRRHESEVQKCLDLNSRVDSYSKRKQMRPQPCSATTRVLAWLIGFLVILGSSIVVLAQEKTLPAAQSIRPHSTVDVSTLSPPPRGTGPGTEPTEIRPLRRGDGRRLRNGQYRRPPHGQAGWEYLVVQSGQLLRARCGFRRVRSSSPVRCRERPLVRNLLAICLRPGVVFDHLGCFDDRRPARNLLPLSTRESDLRDILAGLPDGRHERR